MDSPSKYTGMGCHALLQGIVLTQRSNSHLSCLLHWLVDSLPLVPPEKPQWCSGCSLTPGSKLSEFLAVQGVVLEGQLLEAHSVIELHLSGGGSHAPQSVRKPPSDPACHQEIWSRHWEYFGSNLYKAPQKKVLLSRLSQQRLSEVK